jgi:hypothetical protein
VRFEVGWLRERLAGFERGWLASREAADFERGWLTLREAG